MIAISKWNQRFLFNTLHLSELNNHELKMIMTVMMIRRTDDLIWFSHRESRLLNLSSRFRFQLWDPHVIIIMVLWVGVISRARRKREGSFPRISGRRRRLGQSSTEFSSLPLSQMMSSYLLSPSLPPPHSLPFSVLLFMTAFIVVMINLHRLIF